MVRITITGIDGSNGDFFNLTKEKFYSMLTSVEYEINDFLDFKNLNWGDVEIIVSPKPWASFIGVQMFINIFYDKKYENPKIKIVTSEYYNPENFQFEGGKYENYLNKVFEKFDQKMNLDSFNMFNRTINSGNCSWEKVDYRVVDEYLEDTDLMFVFSSSKNNHAQKLRPKEGTYVVHKLIENM